MERWLIRMTLMTALLLAYLSHQPLESNSGFPVLLQENDTLFDSNSSESMIDLKSVKLIFCGANVGTVVVIDDRTLLTANHVTEGNLACIDDITGDVGSVDLRDTENDISTIKFARKTFSDDHKLKISCKGFKKNNIYYAVGWERGTDLVVNRLKATGSFRTINAEHSRFEHVSVLIGRMVKGMSGGPVIDKNGKMVGMNTATDSIATAFSKAMRDTVFCYSASRAEK